ncbi:MAG: hypothetical protein VKP62_02395 [Candidatus Sericytochromatia bacterium]|nr:hypothetical protein [Candidatus Sericytochromatia bacterium]
MICSRRASRTSLFALVLAGSLLLPVKPAHALMGVTVAAGAGIHAPSDGLAGSLWGSADAFGWGVAGHFWRRLSTTPDHWLALQVRKNVSPIPMISIMPGVGVAGLGGPTQTALGPMASVTGRFAPFLLPFAFEAQAGAAWINNSLALPYSVGAKISLIPFTAVALRWRGWEGNSTIRSAGPELGVEAGF